MGGVLNITIHSLRNIAQVVKSRNTDLNIVSIRDSDRPESEYNFFKEHRGNYSSISIGEFDDIEFPADKLKMVTSIDIDSILKWACDKNMIAVHCTAGVSRSSAVAYLIACSKMPVSEAIKVLNPGIHYPNALVLQNGINMLRNPSIYDQYRKWLKIADERNEVAFLRSTSPFRIKNILN